MLYEEVKFCENVSEISVFGRYCIYFTSAVVW